MPAGVSPGGVLNDQEPTPAQPQPWWRQYSKWVPAAIVAAPLAVPAAIYVWTQHWVDNGWLNWMATYATGVGAELLGTWAFYEAADYFEFRTRASNEMRDSRERDELRRRLRANRDTEVHRREVTHIGGYPLA